MRSGAVNSQTYPCILLEIKYMILIHIINQYVNVLSRYISVYTADHRECTVVVHSLNLAVC